jgi:DNA-binding SARP family transcriptional activator/nucleoid-associated protein YgaU
VNRRAAQVARSLGALAALAVLLAGPPLLFSAVVGWPLPTSVPDPGAVTSALRSGVSDDVIVKTLAVLGWVAWLQVAVAILVEVITVARRRPSVRIPVLPGLQGLAGRLVTSVMMMTAAVSPAAAAAAPSAPAPIVAYIDLPAVPVEEFVPTEVAAAQIAVDDVTSPSSIAESRRTITVERHDSYWAIAERTLGSGYRWREIRDLNVGRTMNTGHVVEPGSDLVLPGWELDIPSDAPTTSTEVEASTPADTTPEANMPDLHRRPTGLSEVVVESGDSFWTLAEEQIQAVTGVEPADVDTAPYWQAMIDANEDRLLQADNPSLIVVGQHLVVPPVVDAATIDSSTQTPLDGPAVGPPTAEVAPPPGSLDNGAGPAVSEPDALELPVETSVPTATAPTKENPTPDPRHEPAAEAEVTTPAASDPGSVEASSIDEFSPTDAPVVPIAAGIVSAALASGAIHAIRRRRKRAMRRTPVAMAPPSPESAALHHALLIDADNEEVDTLRTTLGALARDLSETDADVRPRVAQHSARHLDLVMTHRATPPPGWTALDAGHLWTLTDLPSVDGDSICAGPLLVSLGQPDDDGQLYLDLEAERVVSLSGERDTARSVALAMLLELALTPLADTLEVLVVGDLGPPEVAGLDHVTHVASWDDVAGDLVAWVEKSHAAVAENGWPNAFIARGIDPFHDALAPIVAASSEPPPPGLLDQLRRHPLATLAIVAVGDIDEATIIECQPDRLTIVDLNLECAPYPMKPETLDTIVELVHDTDEHPCTAEPATEPSSILETLLIDSDLHSDDDFSDAEPAFEVLVRVLGDIRVQGGEPLAAKQTAVVTYIALHGTVSADKLEDAVWASATTSSRRKRLANTISECRAALGRHHFPPASDGRYRAGPGIATDLSRFEHHIRRAAGQAPADAADSLLSALELITGPLFTYRAADRASFAWVDVENWISTWEVKVALAAQQCTELLLGLGRTDEAVDTAARILGIMPTHAGLTEALMRAHAANGDRLAVRRVFEEHVRALDALDLDAPDDSTLSLFEALVGARSV